MRHSPQENLIWSLSNRTAPHPNSTPNRSRLEYPRITPLPRWRNWQTHCFEVAASNIVQVQILSWASEPVARRVLLFPKSLFWLDLRRLRGTNP